MTSTLTGPWRDRVDAVDWDGVRSELDRYGCVLTGPLLTPDEAAEIASLYPDIARFRSTVDTARHRFGEGQWCVGDPLRPGLRAARRRSASLSQR